MKAKLEKIYNTSGTVVHVMTMERELTEGGYALADIEEVTFSTLVDNRLIHTDTKPIEALDDWCFDIDKLHDYDEWEEKRREAQKRMAPRDVILISDPVDY